MSENTNLPTLLIAEEQDELIDLYTETLSPSYNLLIAKSYPQALKLINNAQKIDLLIIDDESKSMQCEQLCNTIRNGSNVKHLPIFVTTPTITTESITTLFSFGITDFLKKPLSFEEVKVRLGLALEYNPSLQKIAILMDNLKTLSERDPLKSLYNRYALNNMTNNVINQDYDLSYPLGVLMIDIDFFDEINSSYGESVGKQILDDFSTLITKTLRNNDLVIRFSREEFVCFLPYTTKEQAFIAAKKLRLKTHDYKFDTQVGLLHITISICVSAVVFQSESFDNDEFQSRLKDVDTALIKAKQIGRNQVINAE
jgi:two-component system cell cycle response regulator